MFRNILQIFRKDSFIDFPSDIYYGATSQRLSIDYLSSIKNLGPMYCVFASDLNPSIIYMFKHTL